MNAEPCGWTPSILMLKGLDRWAVLAHGAPPPLTRDSASDPAMRRYSVSMASLGIEAACARLNDRIEPQSAHGVYWFIGLGAFHMPRRGRSKALLGGRGGWPRLHAHPTLAVRRFGVAVAFVLRSHQPCPANSYAVMASFFDRRGSHQAQHERGSCWCWAYHWGVGLAVEALVLTSWPLMAGLFLKTSFPNAAKLGWPTPCASRPELASDRLLSHGAKGLRGWQTSSAACAPSSDAATFHLGSKMACGCGGRWLIERTVAAKRRGI